MHFLQAINSDLSVLTVCNKTGGTIKGDINKKLYLKVTQCLSFHEGDESVAVRHLSSSFIQYHWGVDLSSTESYKFPSLEITVRPQADAGQYISCSSDLIFNYLFYTPIPSVLFTQYSEGDKIENNRMGGTCSTYWWEDRCIQGFGWKTWNNDNTWETQV